jgi:hypothetical protein
VLALDRNALEELIGDMRRRANTVATGFWLFCTISGGLMMLGLHYLYAGDWLNSSISMPFDQPYVQLAAFMFGTAFFGALSHLTLRMISKQQREYICALVLARELIQTVLGPDAYLQLSGLGIMSDKARTVLPRQSDPIKRLAQFGVTLDETLRQANMETAAAGANQILLRALAVLTGALILEGGAIVFLKASSGRSILLILLLFSVGTFINLFFSYLGALDTGGRKGIADAAEAVTMDPHQFARVQRSLG